MKGSEHTMKVIAHMHMTAGKPPLTRQIWYANFICEKGSFERHFMLLCVISLMKLESVQYPKLAIWNNYSTVNDSFT